MKITVLIALIAVLREAEGRIDHSLKNKKRVLCKKWLLLTLTVLASAMILSSCGAKAGGGSGEGTSAGSASQSESAVKKMTLLFHFKSSMLDPSNDLVAVRAGITETLVRLDENLAVQPWLATRWEAQGDDTWIFEIRNGVTFQDGAPLDAAAVQASLERAVSVNGALKNALDIKSMQAQGQQLTIVTNKPNPALVSELINPYASIINVEAEKAMGTKNFNLAPVGTGPFKVTSFSPGIQIQLECYDGYWDGASPLQQVDFKFNEDGNVRSLALQSGEVDIATQLPAESVEPIEQSSDLHVESLPGLRVHFLLFNPAGEATKELKVRQALNLLLDRQSIANDVMLGYAAPANGPFNASLPFGSTDPVQPENVEQAKALLQEAGYVLENGKMVKDGQPLTLELLTYKARPELPLIAQVFQSEALKAGVTINIRTVENVDTAIRDNNNWDIVTYSNLSAPRGDGGYFLNSALMPGGALNAADIEIDELSGVVNTLNAASDMDERIRLTQEAVEISKQYMPHAYIVYPNIIVGMSDRVTGWKPGAEDYYFMTNKMDVN